jgi:hypothetical protein
VIVTFEVSKPFQPKPMLRPQKDLGFRIIWLWFGFSIYRCSWSTFLGACIEVGKEKKMEEWHLARGLKP